MKKHSTFFLLHVVVQFSQCYLLKRLAFLHCLFLSPFLWVKWSWAHGFSGLSVPFHRSVSVLVLVSVLTLELSDIVWSQHDSTSSIIFFLKIIFWLFRVFLYTKIVPVMKNAIDNLIGTALGSMSSLTMYWFFYSNNMVYISIFLCHLQFPTLAS